MSYIFNGNPITSAQGTTQSGDPIFSQMSLDSGIEVCKYALLCQIDASPYEGSNKHTPGYRTEIYFPRCAEKSEFETIAGHKQTAHGAGGVSGLQERDRRTGKT